MGYLTIKKEDIVKLASDLKNSGKRLVLPVRNGKEVLFTSPAEPELLDLSARPRNSIKEFFFPPCDRILEYRYESNIPFVSSVQPDAPETVILGARPCDASSLPIVEPLWNWDYKDGFFNERRKNAVLITLACREAIDEACFCTSVGLSPSVTQGSDILLHQIEDGLLACDFLTTPGLELEPSFRKYKVGEAAEASVEASREEAKVKLGGKVRFDKVSGWIEKHFEDPLWDELTTRCLGCGVCSFLCPTCHCFDIQDEASLDGGRRVKNWDSCQFALFTLHASGHNPRDSQAKRYRQRIYHKYFVYPKKFGHTLCTGCGRCVESCPVNLSIYEVLLEIQQKAEEEN